MIVMKITIDDNRFMELEATPEDLDRVDDFFYLSRFFRMFCL